MERVKLTYEDYVEIAEDGKRHEIIDGEEYVTPSPRTRHQAAVLNLGRLLKDYADATRQGVVYIAPLDVILSNIDVVQPDVIFIAASRKAIVTEANVQGVPDLLIEVVSEGNRRNDEIIKKRRYEKCGVREYWIVDPELQTVKIFRLEGVGYGAAHELTSDSGDVITSPLLPGFEASLSAVFAL